MFQLESLPPAGDEVKILVEGDDGRTTEIEGVHWPELGWTDAVTLLPVDGDVLGWRERPFRREPPPVDFTGWTDEEVAAEIKSSGGSVMRDVARIWPLRRGKTIVGFTAATASLNVAPQSWASLCRLVFARCFSSRL